MWYNELTSKTGTLFSTAVEKWDVEFYVKVSDDAYVNLGKKAATLARHHLEPRMYIGKYGPVVS